ncbi:MAG: tRNA (adenosine(37)-N6)-dimethylallyltransferase MiaA [Chloroflexota bacterium]
MTLPPLLVIAGATATGKTGLSLQVGESLRGEGIPAEIISADSRQVYRGLDIATAKVSAADRARVPHHGLDLVDPDQPFSVADFVRHARGALSTIAAGGGLAILVGGTGLYLRAVARGLDVEGLPSDPELRARIDAALIEDGLEAAVERLRQLAPALANSTDLRNSRRVSRALEIAELAGDVERPPLNTYPGPATWLGLSVPTETHRAWIGERARVQFAAGLIEEAAALRQRWDPALPAFSAIGYREAWSVLDGTLDRDAAIAEDARRNLAFARRQGTWFRSEPGIRWIDAVAEDPHATALAEARHLVEQARSTTSAPR